ncbi:MAG: CDP-alcohol phosphatidyltransferase family protein [Candidatus Limnocylindria bacterium]
MSASRQHAHDLRRGDSVLPAWVKEAGRALLAPVVRVALALHITPNTVTVIGFGLTVLAAGVVASGGLLPGAAILVAGSLLDAVDGALARAKGGGTPFGGFLDSTLDRAGEAILYIGIAGYFLTHGAQPTWPVLLAFAALAGSFLVSYSRARAEGIGLTASVGLAPRTERLVLAIAGLGLAGLGFGPGLIGALAVIGLLTVATVVQRIWHVWHQSQSAADDTKET